MKCPKCYFIGFDNGQRCKNCGYQFSLSVETEPVELPLRTGNEPLGPFADFPIEGSHLPRSAQAAADLPLFGGRADEDDRPLVSLPASPRAPVAVRKSSPAVRQAPAKRAEPVEFELDLDPLEEPVVEEPPPTIAPRRPVERAASDDTDRASRALPPAAGAVARVGAAIIDLALVLSIDAGVLYLTLKICGLTLSEWEIIPVVPFLAFILMLNGGYMAGATAASGQTVGKMLTGIKVITADPDAPTDRVPLGQAILRSAAYLASALPAGLGFLPAVMGSERRALHDRLAHTRVVKA